MKRTLLFGAFVLAAMSVSAQGNDLQIIEDDEAKTAMVTYRVDKNGNRISNSYSGDVVIPDYSPKGYPVTAIKDNTFEGCKDLKSVKIGNKIKLIDKWAFYGCKSMVEVTIPASVDSIAEGAFSAMEALKKVTIADGTAILRFDYGEMYGGRGMFGYNQQTALETAYVGRNFKSPAGLFRGNESLTTVFVGKNISQLHEQDFAYCDNLTTIYAQPTTPPICAANTFEGVDKEACTVFASQSSLNTYKQADVWKEFFNIALTPTSIQAITNEGIASERATWYTTDGRRLNAASTQPGLYIVNGRKVVIK